MRCAYQFAAELDLTNKCFCVILKIMNNNLIQTPWGKADSVEQIGEGIFFASTSSHGGYFVPTALLNKIPEDYQRRALKWSGSRNWYEEDCEWASVVVSFAYLFNKDQVTAAQICVDGR